ncbi:MAG: histidinol-phosphatase [Verrucomicrobiota bacterium]
MNPDAIFFDSHMHTPLCKHAHGHPSEYVEVGVERGLKGIIFTCHSPMPDRWSHAVRMFPEQFDEYVQLVDEGRQSAPEGFEVRLGMESDFFPGMEPWLEELHDRADFHYILGSVHWHVPEYRKAYWHDDIEAFVAQYFEHIAESAETGLFDCLAHPDLAKNANPDFWDEHWPEKQIQSALDRVAATGVAMEINTSGLNKIYAEMNPGPRMLEMIAERQIPIVIGSDSHTPYRVGDEFENALQQLQEAGFDSVTVFEDREPTSLKIEDVEASLGALV